MSSEMETKKNRRSGWQVVLVILVVGLVVVALYALTSYEGECPAFSGAARACSYPEYFTQVLFLWLPMLLILFCVTPPGWIILGIALVVIILSWRAKKKATATAESTLTIVATPGVPAEPADRLPEDISTT